MMKAKIIIVILALFLAISIIFNVIAEKNYQYNKKVVEMKDYALDLCLTEWTLNCEQECLLDKVYADIETGYMTSMGYYLKSVCKEECS